MISEGGAVAGTQKKTDKMSFPSTNAMLGAASMLAAAAGTPVVSAPPPPSVAPLSGLGAVSQMALVKELLGIEASTLPAAVSAANEMMGIKGVGPLPEQVELLVALLGIGSGDNPRTESSSAAARASSSAAEERAAAEERRAAIERNASEAARAKEEAESLRKLLAAEERLRQAAEERERALVAERAGLTPRRPPRPAEMECADEEHKAREAEARRDAEERAKRDAEEKIKRAREEAEREAAKQLARVMAGAVAESSFAEGTSSRRSSSRKVSVFNGVRVREATTAELAADASRGGRPPPLPADKSHSDVHNFDRADTTPAPLLPGEDPVDPAEADEQPDIVSVSERESRTSRASDAVTAGAGPPGGSRKTSAIRLRTSTVAMLEALPDDWSAVSFPNQVVASGSDELSLPPAEPAARKVSLVNGVRVRAANTGGLAADVPDGDIVTVPTGFAHQPPPLPGDERYVGARERAMTIPAPVLPGESAAEAEDSSCNDDIVTVSTSSAIDDQIHPGLRGIGAGRPGASLNQKGSICTPSSGVPWPLRQSIVPPGDRLRSISQPGPPLLGDSSPDPTGGVGARSVPMHRGTWLGEPSNSAPGVAAGVISRTRKPSAVAPPMLSSSSSVRKISVARETSLGASSVPRLMQPELSLTESVAEERSSSGCLGRCFGSSADTVSSPSSLPMTMKMASSSSWRMGSSASFAEFSEVEEAQTRARAQTAPSNAASGARKVATAADAVQQSLGAAASGQTLGQIGTCYVHITQGQGVKVTGRKDGVGDTYVTITFGGTTRKSKVAKRTINPKWDETFEFGNVLESSLGALPLVVEVMDKHSGMLGGKDIVVGVTRIDLLDLATARHKQITTPLTMCGGGLKLEVTWVPIHVMAPKRASNEEGTVRM